MNFTGTNEESEMSCWGANRSISEIKFEHPCILT